MDQNGRPITETESAFVELLKADLRMGITSAELAKIAQRPAVSLLKSEPRKFLPCTCMSVEDRKQIEADLKKLKEMLAELEF
jgi:hypothetical protein